MERIDEIRNAAKEYGQRSVENMRVCRKLGSDIISAFNKYLSAADSFVIGVPPTGEWEHTSDYHEAAFSFYHAPLLTVGEVQFGMSIQIFDHLWVRQIVGLRKEGEQIVVLVTENESEKLLVPLEYKGTHLNQICELIFKTVLMLYQGKVNVFVYGDERLMTIGFTKHLVH